MPIRGPVEPGSTVTEEYEIRAATAGDAPGVQRVARAAWHATYDDIVGPERVTETVDSWYDPDRLVEDDVRDPDRPFVVAVRGEAERVLGFAEAAVADEEDAAEDADEADEADATGDWHLYRIYVHPEAWGEGIGSALLAAIEAALRERGVEVLRVSVLTDNDVGVAFYESRGFEFVETVPDEAFDVPRSEYVKYL